jgi:hypothetical protein
MIVDDEYDNLTGLRTRVAFEDGQMRVNYSQDIEGALDRNAKLRNADGYAKQGIKNNFQHVAHIPNAVCLQIRSEGGPDAYNCRASELRAYLVKNRDRYGYLFTTSGRV